MKNIVKITLIFTIFLISACAGTGSKTIPNTSISNDQTSTLYFSRTGGYVGGGVLASVKVNGNEIAKLGTKEYDQYTVSGNFNIKVSASGLGAFSMGSDSISGVGKNGSKHFYIISVKQGFFQAKFEITETTESGYQQSQ